MKRILSLILLLALVLLAGCGAAAPSAPAESVETAPAQESDPNRLAKPELSCPEIVSEGERFTIHVGEVPGAQTYVVGVLDVSYNSVTQEVRDTPGDFVVSGLTAGEYTVAVTALAEGKDSGSATQKLTVGKAARDGILGVWVMDSVGFHDSASGQFKMILNPLSGLGQLEWFVFKADGSFTNGGTSYLGNTAATGTWTQEGDTVHIATGEVRIDLTLDETGDSLSSATENNIVTYAYRGAAVEESAEALAILDQGLQPEYAGATEQGNAGMLLGLWCLRYVGSTDDPRLADFAETCQSTVSLMGNDLAALYSGAYYRMLVIDRETITLYQGNARASLPYAYIPEVGVVLQGSPEELEAFSPELRSAVCSLKPLSCGWLKLTYLLAANGLSGSEMINGYYTKITGVIPALGY